MNRTLNREMMIGCLIDAREDINRLIERIQAGEIDQHESMAMSLDFEFVLRSLCFAWHSKWMTQQDIDSGGQELHDRMTTLVPNWGLKFKGLVDVDEPAECDRRNSDGFLSK